MLQAQLIEDILDVSRIITGKLEIEHAAGPAAAAHRHRRHRRRCRPPRPRASSWSRPFPPISRSIDGDAKRLHQVLGNVLSNAVKFTPQRRPRRACAARVDGDVIAIDVQDSGVGIAPEFLPYVFDRFRQADSRSTRRHGGLGLGLAIARHLIEQHRGEIQRDQRRTRTRHHGAHSAARARVLADAAASPAVRARPTGDFRMHGMTVLVVDDQPDSCELLAALFERHGARVVQCDSAESALGVLADVQAHLLVADIAMPDVDGYELIRRVRESHAALPAIAVSAYARPQDRRRALAAGFDGYCAKPVEAPQLLRAVRDVMLASS